MSNVGPRIFIGCCVSVMLVVSATATAAKLNVLFIVADDLRCALSCYGDPRIQTPNIDRLAARGVRFERAYVQYTVCNPSRASFLTGLRPDETGVVDNGTYFRTTLPDIVTMPQLFRQRGWRTESHGKIYHAGPRLGEVDLGKSWDKAEQYGATAIGKQGQTRALSPTERWCVVGGMEGTDEDQPDGITAREVSAAMRSLGDRSWFIGAGFHRPHDPFLNPKKYWDLYEKPFSLWRDPANATPMPRFALGGDGTRFATFTDRERQDFMRGYYAGVSFTDANVGKLMAALDELKLWERTIVVFIGDHGYHLGERGWWNKHTLFERSCRAPMIICAPGIKPGIARGIVEFVDLYPTLADLCGLAMPQAGAGQSLLPLLKDPTRAGKDAAFTMVTRGAKNVGRSIRTERWRYISWNNGADGEELYDHTTDPEEMTNVAGQVQLASVVSDLKTRLKTATPDARAK